MPTAIGDFSSQRKPVQELGAKFGVLAERRGYWEGLGVEGLLEKDPGEKAGQKSRETTQRPEEKGTGSEMPGEKEGQGDEGKGKKVIFLSSTYYRARNCM